MKQLILKIIVIITILLSSYTILPSYAAFNSITKKPDEWMGGINTETTIVWFAIIILGFGYLFLETFLALLGFIFSQKRRLGAFWLLKFPGFLGVLLTLLLTGLILLFDIDWQKHIYIITFILLPSIVYWVYGNNIRKNNPKINCQTKT